MNNEDIKVFEKGGLNELPEDSRDLSHTLAFGSVSLVELPEDDFFVSEPLEFKDQDINYPSDYCAAYASASVSEDQEAVALVPEYSFAKGKKIMAVNEEKRLGRPLSEDEIIQIINSFGLNLRDACLAGVKYGFLNREYDPFHCNTTERPPREQLADWRTWPEDLDMLAFDHRKASFFAVDGPNDFFDNIRAVMYQNRLEQRSVVVGTKWRRSWSLSKDGIIHEGMHDESEPGSGHAFKIFGQMKMEINGKPELCLVAQLSNAENFGDKGIFYFTRGVVNRDFPRYGAFTFKDVNKEKAQVMQDLGVSFDAKIGKKFMALVWFIIKSIFKF